MSKLNVGIDIVSVKRFIDKPFHLNQNFYEHIFFTWQNLHWEYYKENGLAYFG